MSFMSRRVFGARALGAAAAASAAAAGLAPLAGAQTGSLGSAGSPIEPPATLPEPPQGTAVTALSPEQLNELDTTVAVPRIATSEVEIARSPFQRVSRGAGAYVEKIEQINERTFYASIWSPANQRTMRVLVMGPPPSAGPRPTLYCLDGYADFLPEGDESPASGWYWAGGGKEFFMDKNVNVVFTCDAGPTMYRDFVRKDPKRGPVKWETFLCDELPPLVDEAMNGNGNNGLLGISSGATAAFMTAVRHRNLYTTVAGMSGVYDVANLFGKSLWSYMWKQKGISADDVMGGWFSPNWSANDPFALLNGNVRSLRGKTVYLSAAAGVATGEQWGNVAEDPNPVLLGGPFEATAFNATLRFSTWLGLNGVKAVRDYRGYGLHDWPLWRDQLPKAWPVIAKGLGVDGQRSAPADATLR